MVAQAYARYARRFRSMASLRTWHLLDQWQARIWEVNINAIYMQLGGCPKRTPAMGRGFPADYLQFLLLEQWHQRTAVSNGLSTIFDIRCTSPASHLDPDCYAGDLGTNVHPCSARHQNCQAKQVLLRIIDGNIPDHSSANHHSIEIVFVY